jgi:hypothetical protein
VTAHDFAFGRAANRKHDSAATTAAIPPASAAIS